MYIYVIAMILENIMHAISIARVPEVLVSNVACLMSDFPVSYLLRTLFPREMQ